MFNIPHHRPYHVTPQKDAIPIPIPIPIRAAEKSIDRSGSSMEGGTSMSRLMESVSSFFGAGADNLPWCDRDIILGCEREVAEADAENKSESLMRLSWALVHSRQPEDTQRGIAMLEASLDSSSSPLETREKLYLLAVGHYRTGDCSKSRQLIEECLEIAPDWRQALSLKKVVEDRIAKDGMIGIGITATAVGLLLGGIAAAVARKK